MPRLKDTKWIEWQSIARVSDLSEDEIADLEDKAIHLIKAVSLSTFADVGHI